jgi:hypothetical protein
LKICRSLKRPIPVVLSGVRLRGRVTNGPIWKSIVVSRIPTSHPSCDGFSAPPWHALHAADAASSRPRISCAARSGARISSAAVGNGGMTCVPIFAGVTSLAQKSGGDSLCRTRLFTGRTPCFRYAAMAQSSWSDMKRHAIHGIAGDR